MTIARPDSASSLVEAGSVETPFLEVLRSLDRPRAGPSSRPGPARFSAAATKEERCRDVRGGRADTVFTPEQIAAVEAIPTVDGLRVFNWGGRWGEDPDAMHFQINVGPGELARGLASP